MRVRKDAKYFFEGLGCGGCQGEGGEKGRHEAQAPSNQVKNYKQT
jgi:hypothetical protein